MAGGSGSVRMAVLLVAITVMLHSAQEVFGTSGKDLEKRITENCNNYKSRTDPQKDPKRAKVNCKAFLDKFKRAFVNKDPEKITPEAYNDLMKYIKLPKHKDKYLFWSGSEDMIKWLITEKKNDYFYHIYDTIFGSVSAGAAWCGKKGSKEIFTDNNCPDFDNPASAVKCYWRAASRAFAKAATGTVTVLLNDTKFYDSDSFFATDELPYFKSKVTALRVLIATTDATQGKCKNKTLDKLKKHAGALKDKYQCEQAKESDLKKKDPKDWWNTATP